MSSLTADVRANNVVIAGDSLTVELNDGRSISVPLAWYPRLLHGTPEERNNWRLIGNAEGVHWPDLDEDISIENLLLGKPSGESQASLAEWLKKRTPISDERD
jgi:hypothetical protein